MVDIDSFCPSSGHNTSPSLGSPVELIPPTDPEIGDWPKPGQAAYSILLTTLISSMMGVQSKPGNAIQSGDSHWNYRER